MAKNKKRKGASIKTPSISPKKYIQTKARQLPIYACYVNEDWETTKLAQVAVARAHKNGNLTFGIYLTDLLGMGVKDTFFNYNLPLHEFEGLMEQLGENMIECEYLLAHNLIYGAVDFALEFDVRPHRDWNLAQFILEEDTEDFPLIDLEFGLDGKPVFLKVSEEDEWDEEEEDWDEEEDLDEVDPIVNVIKIVGSIIDLAYKKSFPKGINHFDHLIINGHGQMNITEEPMPEKDEELADSIEDFYDQLYELSKSGNKAEILKFQKQISSKIKQYSDAPILHNYLANSYLLIGNKNKGLELFKQCVEQFPNYLLGRLIYAFELIQNKQYKHAWEILKGKYQLQELEPDRQIFHIQEVYIFYAVVALYIFLYENDLEKALTYYDLIISAKDDPMGWFSVETAISILSKAKLDVLEKKYGKELPEIIELLEILPT